MAYDYTDDQAFALEMITEHGRLVELQLLAAGSSTTPWQNPANPVAARVSVPAVFVPPSSATQLGLRNVDDDLIKRSEQILIVAHGPELTTDLSQFDTIKDQSMTWKVLWSETLKPGPVNVLYFFGVKR